MRPCLLSSALIDLLPDAVITRRRERPWRSATFSGVRLILDLQIGGPAAERAINFAKSIEDREFSLPDLLVADIAVTNQRAMEDSFAMTVEALLLDEET